MDSAENGARKSNAEVRAEGMKRAGYYSQDKLVKAYQNRQKGKVMEKKSEPFRMKGNDLNMPAETYSL